MSLAATNDDATSCRLSAVKAGYINDDFVSTFTRRGKSMPLINRGTALRTTAINTLIHQFIQQYSKIQILSLGAGFDTRVFYLQDSKMISYWEIDVPMIVSKKIMIILKSQDLSDKIPDFKVEDGNLKSSHYTLISGDLKGF